MMKRILSAALLGALSLSACAQQAPTTQTPAKTTPATGTAKPEPAVTAGSPEAEVLAALKQLDPAIEIGFIGAAPFAGFREVLVGGQVVYVSDDGRYLMQAQPFDLQTRQTASSQALLAFRRQQLAAIPQSERIVFAPPNAAHVVTVFTDVECGYCRKLHTEIAELNKLGIAVEYLAFPRRGLDSEDYKEMVSVWCAADPRKAMTDAKAGKRVPAKSCENPVASHFAVGQSIGVSGTPAVFAEDGTQLGGYLPPATMRQALDRLKAGEQAPAGAK